MFASVGAAVVGWWLAQRAYKNADKGYKEPIRVTLRAGIRRSSANITWTRSTTGCLPDARKWETCAWARWVSAKACGSLTAEVIDGAVNGAGWTTRMGGTLSNLWDKWIIDGLFVNGVGIVTRLASYPVRLVQWGLVQWYALVMVAGLVGFVCYYVVKW